MVSCLRFPWAWQFSYFPALQSCFNYCTFGLFNLFERCAFCVVISCFPLVRGGLDSHTLQLCNFFDVHFFVVITQFTACSRLVLDSRAAWYHATCHFQCTFDLIRFYTVWGKTRCICILEMHDQFIQFDLHQFVVGRNVLKTKSKCSAIIFCVPSKWSYCSVDPCFDHVSF